MVFAHEHLARGAQVVKLFLQKKALEDISKELGIPLEKVAGILRDAGLLDKSEYAQ